MVNILAATTLPVNPPSPSSSSSTSQQPPKHSDPSPIILTREQLYKGLVIKCLRPQDFIGAMAGCEVINQSPTSIHRVVTFKEGMGPKGGKAEEKITLDGGMMATFDDLHTTSHITNLISQGPNGPSDLYLTFTFSWAHPEISSLESTEAVEKQQGYEKGGFGVVGHTIEVVRGMVGRGEI